MRRKKEDAAESRRRIIDCAARLFRERGVEHVSVAEIMSGAGMTHGGFYVHFKDKNALVAAATAAAFDDIVEPLSEKRSASENLNLQTYIEGYLTQRHISNVGLCCPIAGFAPEALHGNEESKNAIAHGTQKLVSTLAEKLGDSDTQTKALELLATLVGTVVLARALNENEANSQLLRTMFGSAVIQNALSYQAQIAD